MVITASMVVVSRFGGPLRATRQIVGQGADGVKRMRAPSGSPDAEWRVGHRMETTRHDARAKK
jgi:hypothetical protein